MEFRLTYHGLLLAESPKKRIMAARATHKHDIRKAFHPQLKRLWQITPILQEAMKPPPVVDPNKPRSRVLGHLPENNRLENLAERFTKGKFQFAPLITSNLDVGCSIDVLFLRSDPPGSIIKSGDIDNRLKTLFDALTMPQDEGQLGDHHEPAADETPFFCLLEDDSLITKASVETDVLLQPAGGGENDARVIITIRTYALRFNSHAIAFI